jgi:hypothetical protein
VPSAGFVSPGIKTACVQIDHNSMYNQIYNQKAKYSIVSKMIGTEGSQSFSGIARPLKWVMKQRPHTIPQSD